MENFFDYQFNITKVLTPVAGKDDDRFGFLPLRQLDADCEVPFNVYLKVKHKDNSSIDFINCCHQSQIFQREWKLKLTELNITGVYYSIYEEGEVIKYLNNNLCVCLEKDNLRYEENIARICDVTLIWLRHFYVKNQARTGENLDFALKYIDGLWAMISTETIHGSCITDI